MFQSMMDKLLWNVGEYAAAYLDDAVIHSTSWSEHLQRIQLILQKLRRAGLTSKPKKCQFGMTRCSYLGHVVGNGEVQPEQSKLEVAENFPKKHRRFIANYANVALPLRDLTKKDVSNKMQWTTACDNMFNRLKQLLCSSPLLQSPDFEKPLTLQQMLQTEVLGPCMAQVDAHGMDHPVAFYRKKLLPREQRYSHATHNSCLIKI